MWPWTTSATSAKCVSAALVVLAPELHGGVGPVVEEALDPFELALRVIANAIRDLGVLALDDRPQRGPPRAAAQAAASGSASEYSPPAGSASIRAPPQPTGHRSRATAIAEPPSLLPVRAPSAQAASVAPVVTTSSTRRTQRPVMPARDDALRPEPERPGHVGARSSRPSSNWATVARRRSSANAMGRPRWRAAAGGARRLVVAALTFALGVDGDRHDHLSPDPDTGPAPPDRRPQRLRQPTFARVFQVVERRPHRPGGRRTTRAGGAGPARSAGNPMGIPPAGRACPREPGGTPDTGAGPRGGSRSTRRERPDRGRPSRAVSAYRG